VEYFDMKSNQFNRITFVAENNCNPFIEQILCLRVPSVCRDVYKLDVRDWQLLHLSNGAVFLAPQTERGQMLTAKRTDKFPSDYFVTSREIGIAATFQTLSEQIAYFNSRAKAQDYVTAWVKMLNLLYSYKETLRERATIDSLVE
jgi:hypothetical protein